jgi:cytochrome c biogenesis protein CcmG, thiol:disulfide interchange protein DsbE
MTQPDVDVLLRIEGLLRVGKQDEAQKLLVEFLRLDPTSARAWWLMSLTISDIDQQKDCLERVLHLNPEDELARERLEMLKNQPILPPAVNPFFDKDLSDLEEPSENPKIAPAPEVPGGAVPESGQNPPTPEPAAVTPGWAAPAEGSSTSVSRISLPERAPAVLMPREELPIESLEEAPAPQKSKMKWWLVDILMGILAVGLISILAYFVWNQQSTQIQATQAIIIQQQTQEMAQTLENMPFATLNPTWTGSPTRTLLPSATFTRTPTFTPTLRYTLTKTLRPSALVGPIVGLYAPDFDLIDQVTGQKVTFSQYDGKPALIFFFSTSCSPCINEINAIENIYRVYKDSGLVLLAIASAEDVVNVDAFRRANQLTFPILLDPASSALKAYRVDPVPAHFFVNTAGWIKYLRRGVMTYDELNTQVESILLYPATATP